MCYNSIRRSPALNILILEEGKMRIIREFLLAIIAGALLWCLYVASKDDNVLLEAVVVVCLLFVCGLLIASIVW